MVAHLVRLKLDLLRNTLRRSRAQAIGLILGVLYGAFVVVALAIGVAVLRAEPDVARLVVIIGGAAGIVLWILLPIFAVPSLESVAAGLRSRGWRLEGVRFEIPDGPCYRFQDPSGNPLAARCRTVASPSLPRRTSIGGQCPALT